LAGVDIDWKTTHGQAERRRLVLPTYPFERTRHWPDSNTATDLEPQPSRSPDPSSTDDSQRQVSDWCYLPSWTQTVPRAIPGHVPPDETIEQASDAAATWLVFCDPYGVGAALSHRLRARGLSVTEITYRSEASDHGAGADADAARIDPADADGYQRALTAAAGSDALPDRIVHCWAVEPSSEQDDTVHGELAAAVQRGYGSLLMLARALAERGLDRDVQLDVITGGVYCVGDAGKAGRPALAELAGQAVLGPCRVIPQEYNRIRCRSIDIAPLPAQGSEFGPDHAALVEAEIMAPLTETVVAVRGRRRWIPSYQPCPLPAATRTIDPPAAGGSWLLVCGADHAGPHIAGYLTQELRATVVLPVDAPVPESGSAGAGEGDATVAGWRSAIRAVEDAGGTAVVEVADSGDPDALRALLARAETEHGPVRGAIITRGCSPAGFSPIAAIDPNDDRDALVQTLRRLYAVHSALGDAPTARGLLFGSLASTLGGLGVVRHAAASTAASELAIRARAAQDGSAWLAVHWDPWPAPHDSATYGDRHAMTGESAGEALARVLGAGLDGAMLLSTGDLDQRRTAWIDQLARPASSASSHARPALDTPYVAPRDDDEAAIAAIWQDVLGIESVGIHDDFFQLGGHSLLATAIVGRLREAFATDVPLQQLFEAPTVAQTAVLLRQGAEGSAIDDDDPETRDLLRLLSEMSEEEVEREIEQRTHSGDEPDHGTGSARADDTGERP
ncbi:MAG: phosphopantetheine-binding protein, partial [Myxococcota bacterium]